MGIIEETENHTPGKVTLLGLKQPENQFKHQLPQSAQCLPKRETGGVAGEARLSSEVSGESVVNNIQPTIISDRQSQENMTKRKIHYKWHTNNLRRGERAPR